MGIHVLIIDNGAIQTRMIAELIADAGCEGRVLDLKPEAGFPDAAPADILIGDIRLSGLLKKECTRGIFLHKGHIPVILVSGSGETLKSLGELDPGLSFVVTGPADPKGFLQTLSQALMLRKYQKQILNQKKMLEKQLVESEGQFKSLFESIQEGFYRSDGDGCLVLANPVAVKMFGYDSFEQMEGMEMTRLFRNPGQEKHVMAMLREQGSISAHEIEIIKQDGEFGHVLVNARLRYDTKGRVIGSEGTLVDITEKKQLEKELTQAQKLESIGQLAAGIAHELNTPVQYVGDNVRFLRDAFDEMISISNETLGFIKGLSEDRVPKDLAEQMADADLPFLSREVPAAISQSLEGVGRIRRIVRSMKEFSHPGGEGRQLADMNQALEHTAIVSKSEWKYVAELELDLDPGLPRICCNPGEMNQVFLNLITNASHAVEETLMLRTKAKGVIRIRTRDAGDQIEIQVSDTGNGIPESSQARVFDPFFTTKKVGMGTGQGLAVSRSVVVEKHGGRIWFESREGKGTTFYIRLPKPKGEDKGG